MSCLNAEFPASSNIIELSSLYIFDSGFKSYINNSFLMTDFEGDEILEGNDLMKYTLKRQNTRSNYISRHIYCHLSPPCPREAWPEAVCQERVRVLINNSQLLLCYRIFYHRLSFGVKGVGIYTMTFVLLFFF